MDNIVNSIMVILSSYDVSLYSCISFCLFTKQPPETCPRNINPHPWFVKELEQTGKALGLIFEFKVSDYGKISCRFSILDQL